MQTGRREALERGALQKRHSDGKIAAKMLDAASLIHWTSSVRGCASELGRIRGACDGPAAV